MNNAMERFIEWFENWEGFNSEDGEMTECLNKARSILAEEQEKSVNPKGSPCEKCDYASNFCRVGCVKPAAPVELVEELNKVLDKHGSLQMVREILSRYQPGKPTASAGLIKEVEMRNCKQCGRLIKHKHPNAKFCNLRCKDRFHNTHNPRGYGLKERDIEDEFHPYDSEALGQD